MRLTLTLGGRTVTIETEREDYTVEELAELCGDLLAGAGYVVEGIVRIVDEDE